LKLLIIFMSLSGSHMFESSADIQRVENHMSDEAA